MSEVLARPQQPGVEEVKLAPQLVESVLNGGPRKREAEVAPEGMCGAGDLTVGVLDRLCLIQDHCVPVHAGQPLSVDPQDTISGECEGGIGVELASRAVVERSAQSGAEAFDLFLPAVDHAGGGYDQGATAHATQRLQRLAQAHVVGQQAAETRIAQELKPAHSAELIRTQLCLQVIGKRRLGQAVEVLDQDAQALKAHRRRLAERVAQPCQVGQGEGRQGLGSTACREQIRHGLAVALHPVDGELCEAPFGERHQALAALPGAQGAASRYVHRAPVHESSLLGLEAVGVELDPGL